MIDRIIYTIYRWVLDSEWIDALYEYGISRGDYKNHFSEYIKNYRDNFNNMKS